MALEDFMVFRFPKAKDFEQPYFGQNVNQQHPHQLTMMQDEWMDE
jgi:hypothetical protein